MNDSTNVPPIKQHHVWPWIVAAFLGLGVVLAVIGLRQEAQRVREYRQLQVPHSGQ